MKRLLPVIIALCILVASFILLPKSEENKKDSDLLETQLNEYIAKMKENGETDELEKYWVTEYDRGNAEVDKSGITGENGKIIFAAEASFEPACFAGEGGELQGFSIDFIYRFCREYGYEPEIKCYEYTAMNDALSSGKVDIAVGVLEDEERAEEMTFTDNFIKFDIIAVYDSAVSNGFNSLDELNGKKVGIQSGTGYEQYLEVAIPDAEPVFFGDFASIYPALQQGKIDAMLTESVSFGVEKTEMPSFVAIDGSLETMPLRTAVAKTDDGGTFLDNLQNSFSKTFLRESRWQMFVKGVGITLLLTITSAVLGTILGLLIYLWCAHGKKAETKFTNILCWIMNSTPTVVLLMVFYYVIFGSYTISNTVVAIIAFTIHFACIFYDHIISGVKAVGNGQVEAGRAQGFTQDQTFFKIIFPQAAEHFMPQYQGSIVSLIQETSVVGYIAIMDLTKMSDLVRARTYEAFFPLLATALIYFLLIWVLTSIVKFISKKIDKKNRKKEKILKGIKLS